MLYIKEEMSSQQYQQQSNPTYYSHQYSTSPRRTRSPPPPSNYQQTEDLDDLSHSPSSHPTHLQKEEDEDDDIQEIPLLTTQEEFIQAIKKWVAMDNQLRILNARAKESRESRNLLTQQIHQYVEDNNLDYPSIEISDGELILCEKREYSSLTFSYIDHCLSQLIKEPSHVERIMATLRENRECHLVPDIRRSQRK